MPWDVFISHASEDKAAVAEPLARALEQGGISVWIDKDQIRLGDSLRRAIDHGLVHCRYGVVILSPSFFKKQWTQKELDALFNRETVDGRKVILPVVHNLSIEEVRQHSPTLASVLVAFWSDGVAAVVGKIVEVVTGYTPPEIKAGVEPPGVTAPERDTESLVLVLLDDGRPCLFWSEEVAVSEDKAAFRLKVEDGAERAVMSDLAKGRANQVGVAYGMTSLVGRVESAIQRRIEGKEVWNLELRPEKNSAAGGLEMTYADYSPDTLAEMRARRILLNEKLPSGRGRAEDRMHHEMLEMFVAGQSGFLKVPKSPLPRLYQSLMDDPELFVAGARLFAVLSLQATGTVEHIHRLDLKLAGPDKLSVRFEGQRPRRFSNVVPPVIKVEGVCELS